MKERKRLVLLVISAAVGEAVTRLSAVVAIILLHAICIARSERKGGRERGGGGRR